MTGVRTFVGCVLAWVSTMGCRADAADEPRRTELTVLAASSLKEAFEELARGFEAADPDVLVRVSFAGSQVLRLQIEQGAPADVYAAANEASMRALAEAGLVEAPRTFAENELALIVPAGNPAGLERFSDLGRASRIVVGSAHAPIGLYTRALFERAGAALGPGFVGDVEAHVVSEETNARLVRAKVELGEADAAIVYRTDAISSDRVRVVEIPGALNVRARYPLGIVAGTPSRAEAARFVRFVASPLGRRTLRRHGFRVGGE